MTKLFWVNKVKAQAPSETHQIRHITHEWHEEAHEEVEEKYEEVEAMDESSHGVHDVDIGQIAVDVLDLSEISLLFLEKEKLRVSIWMQSVCS